MLVPLAMCAAGFLLLLKGAGFTVRGAECLAARLGVSPTTIGLTVVAFGTSLPELVVTTGAFRAGEYSLGTGNIIGSNIANIGLILALLFVLIPSLGVPPHSQPRLLEHALFMLAATVVFILFALRGYFDLLSGAAFLLLFSLILYRMWGHGTQADQYTVASTKHPGLLTVGGLAMVALGAELLVRGAVAIAEILAVPPAVIGLSLVAIGTSIPELATSVVAAIQKSPGISIGNILGSNIFNLLFIIGINSLVFTIPAPGWTDMLVMAAFTIAVFVLFIGRKVLLRIWGGVLLSAYLLYLLFLYGIG